MSDRLWGIKCVSFEFLREACVSDRLSPAVEGAPPITCDHAYHQCMDLASYLSYFFFLWIILSYPEHSSAKGCL